MWFITQLSSILAYLLNIYICICIFVNQIFGLDYTPILEAQGTGWLPTESLWLTVKIRMSFSFRRSWGGSISGAKSRGGSRIHLNALILLLGGWSCMHVPILRKWCDVISDLEDMMHVYYFGTIFSYAALGGMNLKTCICGWFLILNEWMVKFI